MYKIFSLIVHIHFITTLIIIFEKIDFNFFLFFLNYKNENMFMLTFRTEVYEIYYNIQDIYINYVK